MMDGWLALHFDDSRLSTTIGLIANRAKEQLCLGPMEVDFTILHFFEEDFTIFDEYSEPMSGEAWDWATPVKIEFVLRVHGVFLYESGSTQRMKVAMRVAQARVSK